MADLREGGALVTYLNPVYPKSFPDPFVLKFKGEYFAYSTGFAADGNVFSVVRSNDLVHWTEVGGAMKPLEPSPPYYWAPEVTYDNGKFYLYYSVGNETLMEIRVAVSDWPDGGFVDSGRRLTNEDFAIDAHVFIDDDGSKYLFYATDFLDYTHIGTGTVVDRMLDWFTLEGKPRPVTRAKYDWQVYDPNRKEKGGVRWHTVEGPAVLRRKGLYYEMFSGGNWQDTSYGVSFAVSSEIQNPDEWTQFSDGTKVLPILRTLGDTVVGPGHNCIVRGPNNRELYCVYHRWIDGNRVMAIDRLDFAGERMFIVGASHTPQPAPFQPKFDRDFSGWDRTGDWRVQDHSAISGANGRSEIRYSVPPSFWCELTFGCNGDLSDSGSISIELGSAGSSVTLTFLPLANVMRIEVPEDCPGLPLISKLPDDFDWSAPHLLRIESDHRRVKMELDGAAMPKVDTILPTPTNALSICSENQSVALSSCEFTEGFEELFEAVNAIAENGWQVNSDSGYDITHGELIFESAGAFTMQKHLALRACEFAANLRLAETDVMKGTFGLCLLNGENEVLRYAVDCEKSLLRINDDAVYALSNEPILPDYHQLRMIRGESRSLFYFDDALVADIATTPGVVTCSIFGEDVQLAIEMIRLTAI
jgi:GH43 family beta-xylosidase